MVQNQLTVKYSERSPAITLEYLSFEGKPYTIDLVPAIEFDGFPEPAKDWACSWIPEENVKEIRQTFHVVTKTHETEQEGAPGQCRLWRLSFSAADKKLLISADAKHAPDGTTCRKDILRLLKLDLFDFYKTREGEPHVFPSYNLKMLVLNLFEKQSDSKDWVNDKGVLLARYTDALHYWKTSIAERQLPHYFIARENMLQEDEKQSDSKPDWAKDRNLYLMGGEQMLEEDGMPKAQLHALGERVSKCLENISRRKLD